MHAAFLQVVAAGLAAYHPPHIEWHEDQDNVIGPNLLQRTPGQKQTPSGMIHQNGPPAASLGKFKTKEACLDACLSQFPRTCFSVTHYGEGSLAPPGNLSLHCFAVTSEYYDWFPAFDRLGTRNVSSARVWHGCQAADDCAQNGECADGACACKSGWKGVACTQLDLLPTLNGQDAGYNYVTDEQNVSSWGGVPLRDESGQFHMWVSHFTQHCGIIAWGENSVVLHTTSSSLLGPYTPANGTVEASTVFPIFSHEPDVKRGPNGEWVMFFSHHVPNTGRKECFCKNGVTPASDEACHDSATPDTNPTAMSWSSSPWGPWSAPVIVIENTSSDSNLSPLIRADGSLLGLWRSFNPAAPAAPEGWKVSSIHTVRATDWKDPSTYELQDHWQTVDLFGASGGAGPLQGPTEDPWLFEDSNGTLHALFHNMYGCYPCCGHAFAHTNSTGGLQFTYTGADACGPFVDHMDGSTTVLGRRERPHLLFDELKRPVMLTNGVTVCPSEGDEAAYCPDPREHDRSWTLAQPIRTV